MDINVMASGSTGNCYRISDGTTSLLLDAGIPFKAIQKGCGFKITDLAGCLVTHEHNDHAKAVTDLMKHSVDVYTSKGTAAAHGWSGHRLRLVASMEEHGAGTFYIKPFDVMHDSAEPIGFLIGSYVTGERLLYFTDTYYVKYRFNDLTHIMCECNYDRDILFQNIASGEIEPFVAKRLMKSHMSINTLLDMLRANDLSRVRQIYLLHISSANGHAELFKQRVQALTGAEVYAC
jgi:phosphoribosyl 1,2-cyclic phosphodiesterase